MRNSKLRKFSKLYQFVVRLNNDLIAHSGVYSSSKAQNATNITALTHIKPLRLGLVIRDFSFRPNVKNLSLKLISYDEIAPWELSKHLIHGHDLHAARGKHKNCP